ncbi:MAG: RagB/SusD family nutrient uptake outer membrane protein, partial [Bacteroidota bacterium]
MKEYIIKPIILLGFLACFTACESFLDIEPETSLSTALALDNIEGVEAAINGAYSTMHSDWVERQYLFAECFARTVQEENTLSNQNYQQAISHASWTDLFNTGNYFWDLSYASIDLANKVIQAIPEIESINAAVEERKRQLEGEARFIRGLNYFVLNRFFGHSVNGLSVPLLTAPFIPGDQPARATIEDVKNQVLADLKMAELQMDGLESNDDRATIWAVRALLARVYFEYRDYENAEGYANSVIESGAFALVDEDLLAGYSTNISSENVFTFLGTSIDRAANNLFTRFSPASNNVQLS